MSTLSVDAIQGQTTAANVKLPIGSIVQVVTQGQQNEVQSDFATQTNVLSLAITPKYASSVIHIVGAMQLHPDDAASYWMMRLMRDSTQLVGSLYSAVGYQLAAGERAQLPINHVETAQTTNARTYHVACHRNSGSGTIRCNYGSVGSLTIMEISA